jgi:hypothetical protein
MSLAAAIPAANGSELWGKIPRWFWRLGQAGQQLFIELWFKLGFRAGRLRITDRQIAEMCGRGIRWAQKALRQLLDAIVDGVPRPLIARYRAYGPRDDAGRLVEIIVDFVGPEPRAKGRPAEAPPTPTTAPQAPPARAPEPPEPPEPTPEEAEQARRLFEESARRSRAAREAREQKEKARVAPAPKLTPDQVRAQLDLIRAMHRPAAPARAPDPDPGPDPAGPPPQPSGP